MNSTEDKDPVGFIEDEPVHLTDYERLLCVSFLQQEPQPKVEPSKDWKK